MTVATAWCLTSVARAVSTNLSGCCWLAGGPACEELRVDAAFALDSLLAHFFLFLQKTAKSWRPMQNYSHRSVSATECLSATVLQRLLVVDVCGSLVHVCSTLRRYRSYRTWSVKTLVTCVAASQRRLLVCRGSDRPDGQACAEALQRSARQLSSATRHSLGRSMPRP